METLLRLPLEIRLGALFFLGLILGGAINWAIYSLAWFARPISPWSFPHADAPPRKWWDRLPVIGWLGLRRESGVHGRGFWVRPLLLELATGVCLAWLYAWEIQGGLLAPAINRAVVPVEGLHVQFLAHAVLMVLLLAATFIDFDEKTIPDSITVPGVLLGLLIVSIWPMALLPAPAPVASMAVWTAAPLWLTSSPEVWPDWLDTWKGLALGLGFYCGWALAVTPATITSRRGLSKGLRYFLASIGRRGAWRQLLVLILLGAVGLPVVWLIGGDHWRAMLTALVGAALGGGLVWSIRIVGSLALRKEALGFGDVTLMAMIGAFLGWQATWIVFFASPLAAVVVSLINLALTGRRDLPFGPYLALAAAVVVVRWAYVWTEFAAPIFQLGWMLLAVLGACLMLLMGLLMLWRMIEEMLRGGNK